MEFMHMSKQKIINRIERVASIIEMDSKNIDNIEKEKEIKALLKLLENNNE